jgi:hypothetical protein
MVILGAILAGETRQASGGWVCEEEGTSGAGNDSLSALFVFAKFTDGDTTLCDRSSFGWPDLDSLPAWSSGDSLLTAPGNAPVTGSLSDLFDQMSGGIEYLRGYVFPELVTVDETIAYYDTTYGSESQEMSNAISNVYENVAATIDPSLRDAVDLDGDDEVDFVFVYFLSKATEGNSHVLEEHVAGRASVPDGTYELPDSSTITFSDGIWVSPAHVNIGSVSVPDLVLAIDRPGVVMLASHEYSHLHAWTPHSGAMGIYSFMDTGGDVNRRWGSEILSGGERYKLGWLAPTIIDSTTGGGDTTIVLTTGDIPGNEACAIVKTQSANQYFFLELRDAADSYYLGAKGSGACEVPENHSGLLITHVTKLTQASAFIQNQWGEAVTFSGDTLQIAPPFSPEISSGVYGTAGQPEPVLGKDAVRYFQLSNAAEPTDLFQPSRADSNFANLLTPYTTPGTNVHPESTWTSFGGANIVDQALERQDIYSGISIYNIQWLDAGQDSLEVSIHYAGTAAPADADTIYTDTTWDGLVLLTGDVVVPNGVTLTLTENAKVFAATTDRFAAGSDTTKVEIIVYGRMLSEGEIADDVIISSSRDNDFRHFFGGTKVSGKYWHFGEVTDPSAGDWFGIRLDLEGCMRASYGYLGALEPISAIENTEIKYGDVGLSIEDFAAPKLAGVEFTDITDDRHIYLNETDVFLPTGYFSGGTCNSGYTPSAGTWDLTGGTNVVATNTVSNDAGWAGNAGKTDLVADARLGTDGSITPVVFRPETETDATWDDWGGATLSFEADGSHLDGVEIGHAENPLLLLYPDDVTVVNSLVHHFRETGIWVYGSDGDGASIVGTTVERGSGVADSLADLGILLDQSDEVSVVESTVDLRGLNSATGGNGIAAAFGKTFCETEPLSARLFSLEENLIIGPPNPTEVDADYNGIAAYWLCGQDGDRDMQLLRNGVYDWINVGLLFDQCADTQVTCNHVIGCRRGVDIYRDDEPASSQVRFKSNRLEALTSDADLFAVQTNDAVRTRLGPLNSLRGENRLSVNLTDTKFIYENDSDSADTLNAQYNYWIADTLLTVQGDIESRLAPAGYSVDVTNFFTSLDQFQCSQNVPGYPGEERMLATLPDGASEAPALSADIPTVRTLSLAYPNPVRSGATMDLAIPAGQVGRYVLEVYDVAGRRVLASEREIAAPGRYRIEWSGRDNRAVRAAAGVYFLRLKGPDGFGETRKITLLQ